MVLQLSKPVQNRLQITKCYLKTKEEEFVLGPPRVVPKLTPTFFLEFRKMLTADVKQERMLAARWYLQRSAEWFKRVFYLDAAKVVIAPKGYRGTLGGRQVLGGTYVLEDARIKCSRRDAKIIAFYICVNALEGAVAIAVVTGTSEQASQFLVSAAVGHLPCNKFISLPQARYCCTSSQQCCTRLALSSEIAA
jgi:hypothetical protein